MKFLIIIKDGIIKINVVLKYKIVFFELTIRNTTSVNEMTNVGE